MNRQIVLACAAFFASMAALSQTWQPADTDAAAAEELMHSYLEALSDQDFRSAYVLLTPGMKSLISYDQWRGLKKSTDLEVGSLIGFSNFRVTWYNNPPNSAERGIYAAYDFECAYENTAVCSQTLILHKPDNGSFLVMRHETNFIDHKTYEALQEKQAGEGANAT